MWVGFFVFKIGILIIYIYIYIYIKRSQYIYIYIYIASEKEGERVKEREKMRGMFVNKSSDAVSVAIMVWNGQQDVFVIETYLKNGDFIIPTQQLFCKYLEVG